LKALFVPLKYCKPCNITMWRRYGLPSLFHNR
jgi:hypothetical protein